MRDGVFDWNARNWIVSRQCKSCITKPAEYGLMLILGKYARADLFNIDISYVENKKQKFPAGET